MLVVKCNVQNGRHKTRLGSACAASSLGSRPNERTTHILNSKHDCKRRVLSCHSERVGPSNVPVVIDAGVGKVVVQMNSADATTATVLYRSSLVPACSRKPEVPCKQMTAPRMSHKAWHSTHSATPALPTAVKRCIM